MAQTYQYEIIKLNEGTAVDITSSLIKDIKYEIAIPLTILFNKAIHSGSIPDDIKLAKVIPIYKAKDKELLNLYPYFLLLLKFLKNSSQRLRFFGFSSSIL